MNAQKEALEHLLTLKVMRLTRPSLAAPVIVTTDSEDLPGDILNEDLKLDPATDPDIPTLTSGQLLLIPQNFGNLYLGETFSSYMFTHNDSPEVVQLVSVKADLQTSKNKIPLVCSESDKNPQLAPGATIDMIISHEITEIGTHIMICEVSFANPADLSKRLSFRKFYKFNVLKPLDIKTKIYNAECDEVFMEATVQNLTSGPILLEKVNLEPSPLVKVTSTNGCEESGPGNGVLQPMACRQYRYSLAPIGPNPFDETAIGILAIVWRSSMGERGRLQTSQLFRQKPDYPDIRLSVTQLPNMVKLEEPFSFTCKVSNISDKDMELTLLMDRSNRDMAWLGISGRSIGTLPPGQSKSLTLKVVPLSKGLRHIPGIKLLEPSLNTPFEYNDLAQVFVT